MVDADALVTLPPDVTPAQVEQAVARTGFSRFPVRASQEASGDGEDSGDMFIGYLHVKDVLVAPGERRDEPVPARRIRPIARADASDEVEDVLAAMQVTGSHLAQVTHGERTGIVFLEDILEELVGEVQDSLGRPTR
jgi:CBS domain containing-hemolysin-like protein